MSDNDNTTIGSLAVWAEQHEKRDDDRFGSLADSINDLTESIRNGTIILICGMTGVIGFFVSRDMLTKPATAATATAVASMSSPLSVGPVGYSPLMHIKK